MLIEGRFLGTEEERLKAFEKDWKNNLRRTMIEHRLKYLHDKGIVDSEEIDDLLQELYNEKYELAWSWGVEFVI